MLRGGNFDSDFLLYTKVHSEWITNLKVKSKTIKLPEEKIETIGGSIWVTFLSAFRNNIRNVECKRSRCSP